MLAPESKRFCARLSGMYRRGERFGRLRPIAGWVTATLLCAIGLPGWAASPPPAASTSVSASSAVVSSSQQDALVRAGGMCKAEQFCVGLRLHIVSDGGQLVQDAAWWQSQVDFARRLFMPVHVDFRVISVDAVDASRADVLTREDRDAFLDLAVAKDAVDVFVVRSLGDVDRPGAFIRGVHWRRRSDVEKRWIILSSIAEPGVLAHELGHFFGLPHSKYKVSIMNKSPRPEPPWMERVFAEPELSKIKVHRDRMRKNGRLLDVTTQTRNKKSPTVRGRASK